jgi:hypothetical protein
MCAFFMGLLLILFLVLVIGHRYTKPDEEKEDVAPG